VYNDERAWGCSAGRAASRIRKTLARKYFLFGALFGIGLANTAAVVSIALSRLLTLPCAALCSTIIYTRF